VTLKLGALNLMHTVINEKTSSNKEVAFGALSSFLRSENFEGKATFIREHGGLQFLFALITNPEASVRMLKKAAFLINDFLNTQANIFPEDKTFIGRSLAEKTEFVEALIDHLV
jgi:hypothetical protein